MTSSFHDAETRLRLWQDRSVPLILFVSHANGGGVGRHMHELADAIGPRALVLVLEPGDAGCHALRAAGSDAPVVHAAADRMRAVLGALAVDRVHFHHVHGFDPSILSLPLQLGVPYDVTLHDYFALCPAYHMVAGDGRFCGGDATCHRCDERRESPWPMDIDSWRTRLAAFLKGAERVIAPSEDCAARHRVHVPDLSIAVWPHLRPNRDTPAPAVRVLVPGALSPAKGLDVLAACVEDARARRLPLHFRVLGFLGRRLPTWPEAPLSISGEYGEGCLPDLLAREPGDVVFFAAQCPETYSYTLADALDTDLPIVATNLGAFPERLEGRANGHLVRHDAGPAAINDALLAAAERHPRASAAAGTAAEYVARYLAPTTRRRAEPLDLPALLDAETEPPHRPVHGASLAWLYEDGVEAGKAGSRDRLRAGLRAADEALPTLRHEAATLRLELSHARESVAEARLALLRAEEGLREASGDAAAMRGSTSWRLTAPLRALSRLLRRLAG